MPRSRGRLDRAWTPQFQAAWDAVIRGQQAPNVALQQAQEVVNARLAEVRGQ